MNQIDANALCLECGLCCNGVIFADVQLQPGDNAARLRILGLKSGVNRKFPQPCTAFDGCRCNVYSERPQYCREFECLLLKGVKGGEMGIAGALRVIRTARQRVQKVKQLLNELGDADERVALSKRFRRVKRRLERSPLDDETAEKFGELTLAVHDLNVLLSEAFYPAP
jgi:hypothetical protein